jgi:hypothetical protein
MTAPAAVDSALSLPVLYAHNVANLLYSTATDHKLLCVVAAAMLFTSNFRPLPRFSASLRGESPHAGNNML